MLVILKLMFVWSKIAEFWENIFPQNTVILDPSYRKVNTHRQNVTRDCTSKQGLIEGFIK